MNDPNGLIHYDGTYHLFYQHNPLGNDWGDIHWGHATSRDLVHWTHQPLALHPAPDGLGVVASGCAVLDVDNTSGLQTGTRPPFIAVFTHFTPDERQVQSLAFSNDLGRTWTMFDGNPVLEEVDHRDFRDPKVFWHESTRRWVMIIAAGDHIKFYTSRNLRGWTHRQDFGEKLGCHGDVWECPDLFELPTDEGSKWVLLVSVQGGAPNGGSATQYFLGHFDGTRFAVDPDPTTRWMDYGPDNYAAVTWSNAPAGPPTIIGWMSNWAYAARVPTSNWRGAMTLPRVLSLVRARRQDGAPGELALANQPVSALFDLRSAPQSIGLQPVELSDQVADIEVSYDPEASSRLEIVASGQTDEALILTLDEPSRSMTVDRRSAVGKADFLARNIHVPLAPPMTDRRQLRILLDRSSVEVFVDGGLSTATALLLPTSPLTRLSVRSDGGVSAQVYPLRSTWLGSKLP